MSAVPATKGRRIGEILLELGFASEDAVAKATIEHENTGKPSARFSSITVPSPASSWRARSPSRSDQSARSSFADPPSGVCTAACA
jgi:hypothetical protein